MLLDEKAMLLTCCCIYCEIFQCDFDRLFHISKNHKSSEIAIMVLINCSLAELSLTFGIYAVGKWYDMVYITKEKLLITLFCFFLMLCLTFCILAAFLNFFMYTYFHCS